MRILHIISNMRPDSGGPQEAVRMMLRNTPTGCESEVVTLDDPATLSLGAEPFAIHAVGTAMGSNASRLVPWLRANRARFDGVVLHGMWESLSLAVLRAIAGHTPYVVYPHGMLDPYFKRAFPLKHLKKWLYWLPVQYWVMRRAQHVVFTTAAERDLATQSFWLHRWNATVIALGADRPPNDLDRCREAFLELCPAVRGRRFLLFLGRIDPKKGCELLLRAFDGVSTVQTDLHLVMAGPNSDHWAASLRARVADSGSKDRIHWTGMLSGDAKWGAFAASEVFILPSHQENFGIAVVEALSCGRAALLTTPINIAEDLASDGSALIQDDTIEGVTRLLTRWLALTQAKRAEMGERALASVATRYDMRMNTSMLFALFAPTMESAAILAEAHKV